MNDIREEAEMKLAELRNEFRAGEAMISDLDQRRAGLQETMLRISGAIQALEELLGRPNSATATSSAGSDSRERS